jgi:GMP synthase (glutamine-hydrolysing)
VKTIPRRRPVLWIVDPSLHEAETQGVAEIARDWNGGLRVFEPGLVRGAGPSPDAGYDADAVVLMGSAASVYDTHDWLASLSAWLLPVLRGQPELPLLGICFGHQLIAHLAGGSVDWVQPDRAKTLGVETTHLAGGRLLPGAHALHVVVSHREEVKRAPEGYLVTATRAGSAIDGLEHPSLPIFSFQFHPEARDEFARRSGFDAAQVDERVRADGRRLLRAFLEGAASRTRERDEARERDTGPAA